MWVTGKKQMRYMLAAIFLTIGAALVQAQPADSSHSTGRTVSPETKGEPQPQGATGPLNTTKGGAPAESPQGQTPPGMQAAPEGSSKTVVDPSPDAKQKTNDPIPPASDRSEATRAGTQEPSSKIEGTTKGENASFDRGTLNTPGAPKEVDTAPAKFSARSTADDALPIAGYTLRHLTDEKRRAIFASVRIVQPSSTRTADLATIGALVPPEIALSGLSPLPDQVLVDLPEMRTVMFTKVGEKVVLVNPRTRVVLGVIAPE